jgi:hypothetical protein
LPLHILSPGAYRLPFSSRENFLVAPHWEDVGVAPRLVILCGRSYSGKSTLIGILRELGAQVVSVDEIMTDTATAAILGVDEAQYRSALDDLDRQRTAAAMGLATDLPSAPPLVQCGVGVSFW